MACGWSSKSNLYKSIEEMFDLTRTQAMSVHDLANPKVGKELMKLKEK